VLNNVRVQDARFQQLAIGYQQTVLEAAEETENAIIDFLQAQKRLREVEGAVQASERSVELAQIQYREGATDFNRVFILQEVLVQQQDRLADVQGQVARSLIAVYMALGGGWEISLTGGTPPSVMTMPSEPEVIPAPPPPDV
jgi:outer membrane protein TolC